MSFGLGSFSNGHNHLIEKSKYVPIIEKSKSIEAGTIILESDAQNMLVSQKNLKVLKKNIRSDIRSNVIVNKNPTLKPFDIRLKEDLFKDVDFKSNIEIIEDDLFDNTLKCYIDYPKDRGTDGYIETWKKLINSANEFMGKDENSKDYKKINVILR